MRLKVCFFLLVGETRHPENIVFIIFILMFSPSVDDRGSAHSRFHPRVILDHRLYQQEMDLKCDWVKKII